MTNKQHAAPEEEYKDISEDTVAPVKGFDEQSAEQLAPIMGRFMQAYEESEQDEESVWLDAPLKEELPERSEEEIQTIRKEIHTSVAAWDEDMASIHDACAEGKSKEEWLEGKLQESTIGVNVSDYGTYLAEANTELHQANQETIEGTREQVSDFEEDSEQEWDATNTHELALQLGKEVEVSSLASTVLRTGWKMAENISLGEGFQNLKKVGDALRSGEDQGVKEAASAALKAGIKKGYIPFLPKSTPTAIVSGLACTGVEQAKIMLQFADGDISGGQALNLMGRVATVNAANACSYYGEKLGKVAGKKIGVLVGALCPALMPVGMAVGSFVGGVVGRVAGSTIGQAVVKAAHKIAEVAKPVLKRAWEGIKSVGRSIVNGVKNLFSSIFS